MAAFSPPEIVKKLYFHSQGEKWLTEVRGMGMVPDVWLNQGAGGKCWESEWNCNCSAVLMSSVSRKFNSTSWFYWLEK